MRWIAAFLSVVALAACSRDLSVPASDRLALTAPTALVAPRESAQLSASGGAGGYRFEFTNGDHPSGPDATLDAVSGAYRAGRLGSAQDEVAVVDQAGARTTLRIAVGPRLSVSPPVALVAPGGALDLVVAGGKPPYGFALEADPQSTSTVSAVGRYLAGSAGGVVERVVVTDATGDPAAANVSAEVHVGPALQIYPPIASAAPRETIGFVALGGQGSYAYSVVKAGSSGTAAASIDAAGNYVAGSNDADVATEDVVRVTDGNGQYAEAHVTVGRPLRLSVGVTDFRNGVPVQLTATGGKPPYQFRFAARGNRSRGAIDSGSGVYSPGPNVGSSDVLEVVDAAGVSGRLPFEPRVASLRTFTPARVTGCLALGVGGREEALVAVAGTFSDLPRAFVLDATPGEPLQVRDFVLPHQLFNMPGASRIPTGITWDPDGSRMSDLLVTDGTWLDPVMQGLDGSFRAAPSVQTGVYSPLVTRPNEVFAFPVPNVCLNTQIARISFVAGAVTTSCVPFPETFPSYTWAPISAAATPFPGAGVVIGYEPVGAETELRIAHALPGGGFGNREVLPNPNGQTATRLDTVRLADPAWGLRDTVGALLRSADGSARVYLAQQASAGSPFSWLGVYGPVATPLDGFTSFRVTDIPTTQILTWSTSDGALHGARVALNGSSVDYAPLDGPLPNAIGCAIPVATRQDPDLLVANPLGGAVDLILGDLDGGFGRRPHFDAKGALAIADFDGDGVEDVVVATGKPTLAMAAGGGHQLAVGAETAIPQAVQTMAAGDFFGDGRASLLYRAWTSGSADVLGPPFLAHGRGDGTFDPPLAVSVVDRRTSLPRASTAEAPRTVNLGGDQGPDVWSSDVLLRIGPSVALLLDQPYPGGAEGECLIEPIEGSAGGAPAGAVATCVPTGGWGTAATVWYAPMIGAGAGRTFGAWQQIDGRPMTDATVIPVGSQGARAVFAVADPSNGRISAVAIDTTTPTPSVSWSPLGVSASGPFLLANVTGGPEADLVFRIGGVVQVAEGTSGGFKPPVATSAVAGTSAASGSGTVAPLYAARLSDGVYDDLLVPRAVAGAWAELVIITNDGGALH
jgi:hypothetical protein